MPKALFRVTTVGTYDGTNNWCTVVFATIALFVRARHFTWAASGRTQSLLRLEQLFTLHSVLR